MGLQVRKRTKGKGGWLNFSYSEKNGFNVSVSAKAGPFTWNSGNGKTTRRRLTTDLGNGIRYVSYEKKGRAPTKSTPTYYEPWTSDDTKKVCRIILIVAVVITILYFS